MEGWAISDVQVVYANMQFSYSQPCTFSVVSTVLYHAEGAIETEKTYRGLSSV